MTEKTLKTATSTITAVLAIVVAGSIVTGNYIVSIIGVVLALLLVSLLRSRTKEVTQDERTKALYNDAAGATLKLCAPIAGVGAVILIALQDQIASNIVSAAYGLAYGVCVLLVVHSAFYSYLSRKH